MIFSRNMAWITKPEAPRNEDCGIYSNDSIALENSRVLANLADFNRIKKSSPH
jgi:hypothetical protein